MKGRFALLYTDPARKGRIESTGDDLGDVIEEADELSGSVLHGVPVVVRVLDAGRDGFDWPDHLTSADLARLGVE